ncbi:hypothetical protein P261_00711 [Lachnospiraceae bacterium TWA4]|nr:hypothetical protein P261_00711 [Lachnospiraceae bacterium TWA4]
MGFETEPFGGREIAIYGVLEDFYSLPIQQVFIELLDLAIEKKSWKSEELLDFLVKKLCNEEPVLNKSEVKNLFEKLLQVKDYQAVIKLSAKELEKKFKGIK